MVNYYTLTRIDRQVGYAKGYMVYYYHVYGREYPPPKIYRRLRRGFAPEGRRNDQGRSKFVYLSQAEINDLLV